MAFFEISKYLFTIVSPRFHGIDVRRNYTKRIGFCSKQRGADRPYTFEKLTLRTLATTLVVQKMPLAKPEPLQSSQVCFSKHLLWLPLTTSFFNSHRTSQTSQVHLRRHWT